MVVKMVRYLQVAAFSWAIVFFSAGLSAQASDRVALILGDGKYTHAPAVAAGRDIPHITAALAGTSFKVIDAGVVSRDGFQWAMDLLVRQLSKGGPDSLGFVYFAGYRVSVGGETYLIPSNARIANAEDASRQGYPLSALLRSLAGIGNKAIVVAVDACDANPFYNDAAGSQFTPVEAPQGVLLSLCSAPGLQTGGGTSAYSSLLAQLLPLQGMSATEMFSHLRWSAAQTAGATYLPWFASALAGDIFLAAGGDTAPRPASLDSILAEVAAYANAESTDGLAGYRTYLQQYPDGALSRFANAEIARANGLPPSSTGTGAGPSAQAATDLDDWLWSGIKDTDNPALLKEYLVRFPDGRHKNDAELRLAALTQKTETDAPGPIALPTKSFTASLHGSGEPGWANLYLAVCGEDIQYDMEVRQENGEWSAQLTHNKNGDVISFKQRDRRVKEGSVLLYGNYGAMVTQYTAIIRLTPVSGRKVTFSIPHAGVGNCASGNLN